jgi:hypothetical protein
MSTEEARMDPASGPTTETTTEAPNASTGAKTADAVLADELREFGKQLEGLFQTARTSPRAKEVEAQLTSAWRDVEKGVNNAINKAQSSDWKGTVQGTAQYAAEEIQTGLAKGLKNLNQWMSQKRSEMDEKRRAREAAEAAAATSGTTDNQVADRFSNEPVFGQGVDVPAVPFEIRPDADKLDQDNPITDRFGS